jgi:hypothetical protein
MCLAITIFHKDSPLNLKGIFGMTADNAYSMAGTIAVDIQRQEHRQYCRQLSSSLTRLGDTGFEPVTPSFLRLVKVYGVFGLSVVMPKPTCSGFLANFQRWHPHQSQHPPEV